MPRRPACCTARRAASSRDPAQPAAGFTELATQQCSTHSPAHLRNQLPRYLLLPINVSLDLRGSSRCTRVVGEGQQVRSTRGQAALTQQPSTRQLPSQTASQRCTHPPTRVRCCSSLRACDLSVSTARSTSLISSLGQGAGRGIQSASKLRQASAAAAGGSGEHQQKHLSRRSQTLHMARWGTASQQQGDESQAASDRACANPGPRPRSLGLLAHQLAHL